MAIVTLLTDSGESDHYVAAIKAKIISINPGIRVEDISHKIKPADIAHAAFVLRAVFRDFPKGTVHLVGVDSTGNRDDAFIALQLEDHFFVGCDNGLFGLISEKPHQQLVELNAINSIQHHLSGTRYFCSCRFEVSQWCIHHQSGQTDALL